MTTSPGGYLAFLDLTCCGFGCALLLLLLVAAFNPEPVRSSPRNAATVVHCYRDVRNAGPGPKPEIRIECRRPGRQDWERIDQIAAANPAAPEAFEFTAPAETGGGSESFVIFSGAPRWLPQKPARRARAPEVRGPGRRRSPKRAAAAVAGLAWGIHESCRGGRFPGPVMCGTIRATLPGARMVRPAAPAWGSARFPIPYRPRTRRRIHFPAYSTDQEER